MLPAAISYNTFNTIHRCAPHDHNKYALNYSLAGDIDGMKNSPANGPGTPRDDLPPPGSGDMPGYPSLAGYQDSVSNLLI